MRNNYLSILMILSIFTTISCDKESFNEPHQIDELITPYNLNYAEILNAREFAKIKSSAPSVSTNNHIPSFEIIDGRDADGNKLDDSFMKYVSILDTSNVKKKLSPEDYFVLDGDTIKSYEAIDFSEAGVIVIDDGNNFKPGDYYFSVKVKVSKEGKSKEASFIDAYHLNVGPALVEDLLYSPIAQNLVVGAGSKTTKPYLLSGNASVSFALGDNEDKLVINSSTGEISLKEGYTTVENDTIYPTVRVTSLISAEITEFQGSDFLMLVASVNPVDLPKKTIYFFYPTLQAENTMYGYKKDIIKAGNVLYNKTWTQSGRSAMADAERPDNITGNKSLLTNIVIGGKSVPHESDVIINTQDLSKFSQGYKLSSVFYIKNQYVEYLIDGKTPIDLEIYYSTDYDDKNETATWIQINDQLECLIQGKTTKFIGTPYPGDQKGDDPDGKKDSTKNADGKWVRCELDLAPYKTEKNFTLKFKFKTYFKGEISGAEGRGGRLYISDVHFKAEEE